MATDIDTINAKFKGLGEKARGLSMELATFVGDVKNDPLMGKYVYEANNRLEEFMHRVGDCMSWMSIRTQQGLDKVVDQAVKDGRVVVAGGGDGAKG